MVWSFSVLRLSSASTLDCEQCHQYYQQLRQPSRFRSIPIQQQTVCLDIRGSAKCRRLGLDQSRYQLLLRSRLYQRRPQWHSASEHRWCFQLGHLAGWTDVEDHRVGSSMAASLGLQIIHDGRLPMVLHRSPSIQQELGLAIRRAMDQPLDRSNANPTAIRRSTPLPPLPPPSHPTA